jgi:tetratricopeptide (TPR) repeat protein
VRPSRTVACALPVIVGALCLLGLGVATGRAQSRTQPPRDEALRVRPNVMYLPRALEERLGELDRALLLQSPGQAEALLVELQRAAVPEAVLLPRQIKLARLKGDEAEALRLCRQALQVGPVDPALMRDVAEAALDGGALPEAEQATQAFLASSPEAQAAFTVAVDLWRQHGRHERALALCDSARQVLHDPGFLARPRALCLLALGRPADAADELAGELRRNRLNLPLVRAELLDGLAGGDLADEVQARLERRLGDPEAVPEERILLAGLQLSLQSAEAALRTVAPLLDNPATLPLLLRNASTLAVEAPLAEDPLQQHRLTSYLLTLLEGLARSERLPGNLRPRVLELLAQVAEQALAAGYLHQEPAAAVERMERVLEIVRKGHPSSPHLYSAQIRLARFLKDELHRPAEAAVRLERLLTDLDLPLEGVALARLTLGECYLAAADTLRARIVLTRLGRSERFREAAGHAHFHLARLDMAEGEWETARDRFAAVAMDNPRADYANDALSLGLSIAEELQNPTGGPVLLDLYGRAVYFQLTAQPDSQRAALVRFVDEAAAMVDLEEPQHLLERGRFELAHLALAQGDTQTAIIQCERIVLDHPDGRYPAEALALAGRIHEAQGRWDAAQDAYEHLLLQYPDQLVADDVRERLRGLP